MNVAEHLAALDADGRRFVAVVRNAALDAEVPPCPGWRVRDLIRHLGGIHRWATTYVAQRRRQPIEEDLEELVGGWPVDADLVDWFSAGHRDLVDALRDAPDDLDCFTFLAAPSPRAMWARRQAHETAIHRIDAESATSSRQHPFEPGFAADGIDELLTAFITRRGRGPRASRPTSLAVVPSDIPERWLVSFDRERCVTERTDGPAGATVSGAASDLYPWLWNRPTIGTVGVDGDPAVIDVWQSTVHVRWD